MEADTEKVNQLPLYDGNVTRIWLSSYSKKNHVEFFLWHQSMVGKITITSMVVDVFYAN